MPPDAMSKELKGVPCCAGPGAQDKEIGAPETVMPQPVTTVPAGVPLESTTWILKLNTPPAVGVPLIRPVLEFKLSPPGKAPEETENVYGRTPPEAVTAEL